MLSSLLKNWPLKLLSLILGYAIWFSVIDESLIISDYTVPLEIKLNESQILASTPPTTASVRLEGTETAIRRLDRVGLAMRVDLTGVRVGDQEIQLNRTHLDGVPRELALRFISPDRLSLQIASLSRKRVPVTPTLLGQPAEGYALYSAEVIPDQVVIEGPEDQIAALDVLRTLPIRLENRTDSFASAIATMADSPYIRLPENPTLRVEVTIDETPVEKRFENVKVVLSGARTQLEYNPKTVGITLAAPPGLLATIEPEMLRVTAEVGGLDLTTGPQQVSIRARFLEMSVQDLALISVQSYSDNEITIQLPSGAEEGRR